MDDGFTDRVLDLVERIPPGQVLSYGRIAELLQEGGPRQVGRVMSLEGAAVPWWRVVRADGTLPDSHGPEALQNYWAEGTPLKPSGRPDLGEAFWDPSGRPAT